MRCVGELEKWGAENWGNVAYGSIYHALKQMSSEGLVEAIGTESVQGRPARTAYASPLPASRSS